MEHREPARFEADGDNLKLTDIGDGYHIRRGPVRSIKAFIDMWSVTPNMTNELYANVSAQVQQQLINQERKATVSARTKLVQYGVLPNQLIILNSGLAEITVPVAGKPVSLGTVGPGKVLGLRSIMGGEVPEIDVTCLQECDITVVSRDTFLEVLRRNPEMYFAIVKVLSEDLKTVQSFLRENTSSAKTPRTPPSGNSL